MPPFFFVDICKLFWYPLCTVLTKTQSPFNNSKKGWMMKFEENYHNVQYLWSDIYHICCLIFLTIHKSMECTAFFHRTITHYYQLYTANGGSWLQMFLLLAKRWITPSSLQLKGNLIMASIFHMYYSSGTKRNGDWLCLTISIGDWCLLYMHYVAMKRMSKG